MMSVYDPKEKTYTSRDGSKIPFFYGGNGLIYDDDIAMTVLDMHDGIITPQEAYIKLTSMYSDALLKIKPKSNE